MIAQFFMDIEMSILLFDYKYTALVCRTMATNPYGFYLSILATVLLHMFIQCFYQLYHFWRIFI